MEDVRPDVQATKTEESARARTLATILDTEHYWGISGDSQCHKPLGSVALRETVEPSVEGGRHITFSWGPDGWDFSFQEATPPVDQLDIPTDS